MKGRGHCPGEGEKPVECAVNVSSKETPKLSYKIHMLGYILSGMCLL